MNTAPICPEEISLRAWAWVQGEHASTIRWLKRMGCRVTFARKGEDCEYHLVGRTGITCGLGGIDDPVAVTVMLIHLLNGFGSGNYAAVDLTVKQWHAAAKEKRRGKQTAAAKGAS